MGGGPSGISASSRGPHAPSPLAQVRTRWNMLSVGHEGSPTRESRGSRVSSLQDCEKFLSFTSHPVAGR